MAKTTTNHVAAAIAKLGGITAAVVATGVSGTTLDRWRRYGAIPDAKALLRIAHLTDIPPELLAGLEDELKRQSG